MRSFCDLKAEQNVSGYVPLINIEDEVSLPQATKILWHQGFFGASLLEGAEY